MYCFINSKNYLSVTIYYLNTIWMLSAEYKYFCNLGRRMQLFHNVGLWPEGEKSHDASACKALQREMRIKKAPGSNHESLQRAAVWESWSHAGFSIRLIDLNWFIQHFSCWDTRHFLAVLIGHVANAFDKLMTCSVIGKKQKRPKKRYWLGPCVAL